MPSVLRSAVAVGVGGAAGATCRWAVGRALVADGGWPWATLVVNVVGCLLLGWFVVRLTRDGGRAWLWRDGLGTGFCGGLTTFSTFSVEIAEMVRDHDVALATGYATASLVTGYAAFALGRWTGHRHLGAPTGALEPATRG